jgi:AraC-like DNA-binding protein
MRSIIGSVYPFRPATGYFNIRDEAMTWKETMLDTWNAYFTLAGCGEVSYGDAGLRTGPGELMILRPRVHRDYRIPQPRQGWEFYWLHFNPTARMRLSLPWFNQPDRWQTHKMADASLRVRVASALEEMHQINLCNPQMPGREELLYAMFEAILLRIAAVEHGEGRCNAIDPRIEKALEHFHRDLAARTDVDALAKKAGLPRSQFNLLFRKGTGRSAQHYIEERRLEVAAYYLRMTGQGVSEIAGSVGFENAFYFPNRFRCHFGCSPTDYRKRKE